MTIAHISRWQIELFFKWIKLFYGTSEKLDRSFDLRAHRRPETALLEASLYQILQILSVTQFEKMPQQNKRSSPNESPMHQLAIRFNRTAASPCTYQRLQSGFYQRFERCQSLIRYCFASSAKVGMQYSDCLSLSTHT